VQHLRNVFNELDITPRRKLLRAQPREPSAALVC